MSYCRFTSDSDVYAYECDGGVQFWVAGDASLDCLCGTFTEAYQYALRLREEHGVKVPDYAIDALMADTVNDLVDEAEREIAERYMALPLDADGVPVHVGDKMQYHGGEPFIVCAVAPGVIHTWAAVKLGERSTTYHYAPDQCTHYKQRTLEDVLQCAGVSVAAIEDVAAEIRELLGVSE